MIQLYPSFANTVHVKGVEFYLTLENVDPTLQPTPYLQPRGIQTHHRSYLMFHHPRLM